MELFYEFLLQIFLFSIYVIHESLTMKTWSCIYVWQLEEVWHNISATNTFYFNCIFNIAVLKWVEWVGWNCCFIEGEDFVTSSQTTCFHPLICFTSCIYIQVQLTHVICWWYLNKNSGFDWNWMQHWFKLGVNYWLTHDLILQLFTCTKPMARMNA